MHIIPLNLDSVLLLLHSSKLAYFSKFVDFTKCKKNPHSFYRILVDTLMRMYKIYIYTHTHISFFTLRF